MELESEEKLAEIIIDLGLKISNILNDNLFDKTSNQGSIIVVSSILENLLKSHFMIIWEITKNINTCEKLLKEITSPSEIFLSKINKEIK